MSIWYVDYCIGKCRNKKKRRLSKKGVTKNVLIMLMMCLLGCVPEVPEELVPLLGHWEYKSTVTGSWHTRFLLESYTTVTIGGIEYECLKGERESDTTRIKYVGMLNDNYVNSILTEYEYFVLCNVRSKKSGEIVAVHEYYFDFVDTDRVEGEYTTINYILPEPKIYSFYAVRRSQ